jgi:uncharacterized Tic20 family protein
MTLAPLRLHLFDLQLASWLFEQIKPLDATCTSTQTRHVLMLIRWCRQRPFTVYNAQAKHNATLSISLSIVSFLSAVLIPCSLPTVPTFAIQLLALLAVEVVTSIEFCVHHASNSAVFQGYEVYVPSMRH